ncbi:MAG: two-component system, OmpR family, phosphate regulon sensor histidine kinase PhoR [Miltoncostaeaceae bacterium]|nr:two-component system, OmpR family, phosphate regulon sensor histidine kinase PhoR [Miltoncostaeaceae bacterium]
MRERLPGARRLGLQTWLVAAFLALGAAASVAVLAVVLPTLTSTARSERAQRTVQRVGETLRDTAPLVALPGTNAKTLLDAAFSVNGRVKLLDADGNLMSDPQGLAEGADANAEQRVITAALLGIPSSQVGGTREAPVVYVAVPVRAGGTILGALEATVPVQNVGSGLTGVRNRVFLAVAAVLALAALVGYLIARALTRRIRRLASTAATLAAGNLSARSSSDSPRELAALGESLNGMAARLENLVGETIRERDRARELVASLAEGVLAVSSSGEVTVANQVARRYLELPAEAGAVRLEDLPAEIARAVRRAQEERRGVALEDIATPGGAVLSVRVEPSAAGVAGTVVTLRDVTAERRLERARRDLVTNVSHELKTPVSALKGFLELMEDERMDDARRREFLGLMSQETRRLELLIEEQLELVRLDAGALPLEREPVDLSELAERIVLARRPLFARADVTLRTTTPSKVTLVDADPARIEQILLILLDNALRHTPAGGAVEIQVSGAGPGDAWTSLAVRDTGEGIAPEAQPFVFDRFYRADDSRQGGGAGLGLAIARGLAQAHGGSIEVRSWPGEGTLFTVRLPALDRAPDPAAA